MAIRTIHVSTYFFLLAAAVFAQSSPHSASQVIYLKLKNALITDSGVLYMMQEVFFLAQSLSQN